MKTRITLIIATFLVCFTINAQTKVGTVDREFIIAKLPQLQTVQDRVKRYGARLDSINKVKIVEHDSIVKAYNTSIETLSEDDKKAKFIEIAKLKQEISQFQQNGTTLMQLRRNDFMRTLYQKVNEIIEGIAKEKGYTQILALAENNFAYIDTNYDITKLVLAKLGLKE